MNFNVGREIMNLKEFNMNKELKNAFENSPVWKEETKAMNEVIDEANKEGVKIPDDMIEVMQSIRLSKTSLLDKKVSKLVKDSIFKPEIELV